MKFEDGSDVTLGMLVHKPAMKNRAQTLISQLGVETNEVSGEIVAGEAMGQTNVHGCFAAGDTAEAMKQVAMAVWTGMYTVGLTQIKWSPINLQVFGRVPC